MIFKINPIEYLFLSVLLLWVLCSYSTTLRADNTTLIEISNLTYKSFSVAIDIETSANPEKLLYLKDNINKNLKWSGMYEITQNPNQADVKIGINYVPNVQITYTVDSKWGRRFHDRKETLNGTGNSIYIFDKIINDIVFQLTGEQSHLGNAIIFVEKGNYKGYKLVLIDPFGKGRRVLVDDGNLNILPRWKPDSTAVLFTSLEHSGSKIKQFDFKTEKVKTFLASRDKFSGGTWGPRDELIVTISKNGNSDLYKIDQQGNILERLTQRSSTESNPNWSPDGERLVFISNRSGSIQIYQRIMKTGDDYRMSYEGTTNVEPSWSPNGAYIIFASIRNNLFQIFLMDKEGTFTQQITNGNDSSEQPIWSPSGHHILFTSKIGHDYKLYIMNADGSDKRRVTKTGVGISEFNPTWTANFNW
jgi:tol-pal system beta propeller repeat protein TolB